MKREWKLSWLAEQVFQKVKILYRKFYRYILPYAPPRLQVLVDVIQKFIAL
jgi:hypothetical protein